jgi:hypothetical protein
MATFTCWSSEVRWGWGRYQQVIAACQLVDDFEALPEGDRTTIGIPPAAQPPPALPLMSRHHRCCGRSVMLY